jgi:thiol-disulfide isomerase/thioredoxin
MISNKFVLILLTISSIILTSEISARASVTVFQGKAVSYAGEKLVFLTYTDMISFREAEVASCTVSDSGNFSCTATLDETRLIFTKLGVYNCIFYAEPGLVYQVQLPQKREKTEAEQMNPYFQEITVHLIAKPIDATEGRSLPGQNDEVNLLIRSFNDSFNPFYYKYVVNSYLNAVDQDEINKAIKSIEEPFSDVTNPFFRNYMTYRLGLLKHYGAQQSSSKIMSDFFNSKSVLYNNPAYMELFNEIFSEYFSTFMTEYPKSNLLQIINREINLDKLKSQLQKEKALSNDTLLELVIIKNLYESFYNDAYVKPAILILMDSLSTKTKIAYHKSVISDIKMKITRLLSGSEPPPLSLYDKDSNLISLEDFRGKYVYLMFCNSYSYYCIREFELLNDLNSRHNSHLAIVTILVDETWQSMKDLLKTNNYSWTFLNYSSNPEIINEYDVKAYPSYHLIGPDGKLIASPAPAPMEGFEEYLFKTMRSRGDI